MGRKKAPVVGEFLLFDVLYDDGTRASNRKVPSAGLQERDVDESVCAIIDGTGRETAERSGK